MSEEVWTTSEGGVKVYLPSGDVKEKEEVSAEELRSIARGDGLVKFVAKKDGIMLTPSDFPITNGEIRVEEYNEAK